MKDRNTTAHCVTHDKLHQLARHCDLFRIIAVPNTVPGSNITIKEIIGNYGCSLIARNLFDARGLQNHGVDGKSDLVNAVCISIDGTWMNPWRGELDVAVIDAVRAILHLPKSTKFERFEMFINIYKYLNL